MCFYHAYGHCCGHTEMVFVKFCAEQQMSQQRCPRGREGVITLTVKVEYPCGSCAKKVCLA
ncbi:hypothetical protein K505DRAFT_238236 [Melanomma pulvis-pyrius CBS 109.77]|uniref:Uncharacterized protein n=1 Tax=Melanomma pulvis-pyrius CBS 109.77 TaxID=1314802 RepID=A0A6A6XJJ1_9PLEO|nr:hypothetical protein K505DRAFT_238236 [Melanomma pulvis-pyrius CBS 109.77]